MYVAVEPFRFWIIHHLCVGHLIRVKQKSRSLFSCLMLLTRNKLKSLIKGKHTKCPLFECQFFRISAIHLFRLSSMLCCIIRL